jgi:hypothetical protein
MPKRNDIDRILQEWAFQPGEVLARRVKAVDGRHVLQMRVDMGLLQLEETGRPDGQRPGGATTYYEFLKDEAFKHFDDEFRLTADQCVEADREFVQFYHRRICWLALREYRRAADDAEHSLAFMDFVRIHSPDDEWTQSHEQYRPFVLFHRVQAGALAELEDGGPEAAIGEINRGLSRFRDLFAEHEALDRFESDELVARLTNLKEELRKAYHVGRTLDEQLADAVAAEEYELAARLRDELNKREQAGN